MTNYLTICKIYLLAFACNDVEQFFCSVTAFTGLSTVRSWGTTSDQNKNNKPQQTIHRGCKVHYFSTIFSPSSICLKSHVGSSVGGAKFDEPSDDDDNIKFGRKDYWNAIYKKEDKFSWYAQWDDLQPFIDEVIQSPSEVVADVSKILVPGVGNDRTIVDMYYSGGYKHITAFDYASEGVERLRDLFATAMSSTSSEGIPQTNDDNEPLLDSSNSSCIPDTVNLMVADARDLHDEFTDNSFDVVFEKGTLDAIYLSGGKNKTLGQQYVDMAASEFLRVLKPNGTFICITAVCVNEVQQSIENINNKEDEAVDGKDYYWHPMVDTTNNIYITEDGYTSNNIDGNFLVWQKKRKQ